MLMNKDAERLETRPFPWKCGRCRQREVYPVEEEYTTEVVHDGRSYSVTVPALRVFRCRNCGEAVLDTEANRQISLAFRRQAGLLTPEEIRQGRKALGLKQEELAGRLGVAESTLSRWETGAQIQQRSLDKLLRLFFTLPEVRWALAEVPAQGRFHTLRPTPDLRRQAGRFRLTEAPPPAAHGTADEDARGESAAPAGEKAEGK